MKTIKKLPGVALTLFILLFSIQTYAHQPNIVLDKTTTVSDPEISKVFYGELSGNPHIYKITSENNFEFYVNILVPDLPDQQKNFSAEIIKDRDYDHPFTKLNGLDFTWRRYWEEFGYDWYWVGPEYKTMAEKGSYEIHISNPTNQGKYALAIGQIESFGGSEIAKAMTLIPKIKREFFDESPATLLLSPIGWGYILFFYAVAFIGGFILRALFKKFGQGSVYGLEKNIGGQDRLLRLSIGIAVLLFAIATTWNPFLIIFSGFTIFEATFSWCGLNAMLGRNTCEVK